VATVLRCAAAVGENRDRSEHDDPVCDDLLGYLREHPNAMDTLKGIADWWLPRHQVRVGVERVAQALETLEARGLIERIGDENRPLFRLRQRDTAGAGPDDTEPVGKQ
jgi:hypothetical protein